MEYKITTQIGGDTFKIQYYQIYETGRRIMIQILTKSNVDL